MASSETVRRGVRAERFFHHFARETGESENPAGFATIRRPPQALQFSSRQGVCGRSDRGLSSQENPGRFRF